MIRIYNGGDIKFDISSEKTNIEASVNYYIKFFTTNPDYCITKDKSSIDTTDYTIYLNWDELVKVGRGVLQYTYYYSLTNEKFDDKKFDLNNCLTTDYFIVSDTTYDEPIVANSGLYKYLSDKLTSEVDSRISGDTTLQTSIDTKITNLDSSITTQLKEETLNRTNTDTTLTNNLNSEIQRAQTVESNLSTSKQDSLVSGTNIKTINNQSMLGSGNISTITSTPISDITELI